MGTEFKDGRVLAQRRQVMPSAVYMAKLLGSNRSHSFLTTA